MKEILLSSSVLIGVVMLLRLFRSKVSQRLVYGAWLLVALRLLIPIQLGQWALSLNTLTQHVTTQSQSIQQAEAILHEPVAGPGREEIYQQLTYEFMEMGLDISTPEVQSQLETQVTQRYTAPTLSQILMAVWIGGMVLMALWFLITNLRFLLAAKRGAVPFDADAPVPVRISDRVSTPCLVGLFRPVIYITPGCTETPERLRHVLTHELTHLKHGDHIWSAVRCICLCVYWFDPLVWLAAVQSRRDCELACDEGALKKLGDSERIAYGQTLLSTVSGSLTPSKLLQTATSMNDSKKQLRERMCFIVKRQKNLLIALVLMLLVIALAAGCAFTGSKLQPTEGPTVPAPTEPTTTQPTTAPAPTQPTTQPQVPTQPTTQPQEPTEPTDPTPNPPKLVFEKETKPEALVGRWLAHVQINEYDTFSYILELREDGTMVYRWCYYGSTLLEVLEGTWTPGEDNTYALDLTFTGGSRYEDFPAYDYHGVTKLVRAEDGSAIRADWVSGTPLFHFFSDTRLVLYRYDPDTNPYIFPIQNAYYS